MAKKKMETQKKSVAERYAAKKGIAGKPAKKKAAAQKKVSAGKTAAVSSEFGDEQIERLLSPNKKIEVKIDEIIGGLKGNFNLLVLSGVSEHEFISTALIRQFLAKGGAEVVYVAVSRPAEKIKAGFVAQGIDAKKIKFLDLVSMEFGANNALDKNVSYLSSTSSLNELLDEIMKSIAGQKAGKKLLFFDSVSTLLVYNDSKPVEKMLHATMSKLNKFGADGVFLMAKSKEHEDIIQTISQFCDKIIEVGSL